MDITYNFPPKMQKIFTPAPYKGFHGGRGGSKSWSIAAALLIMGVRKRLRILCCREVQESMRDSVKRLLDDKIAELGLQDFYYSTDREIKGTNGTLFSFAGLRTTDVAKIKSFEGYDIAWIEEADTVSKISFEKLDATIRRPGAEIWASWNRHKPTDYVDNFFLGKDADGNPNRPKGAIVEQINWRDNPGFPERLRDQMERDKRLDYEYYLHKWEGHLRSRSDAAVFRPPTIRDMDDEIPTLSAAKHGADWGMRDPTVLVRCYTWKEPQRRVLYIAREVYKIGCEIEEIPALFAGHCPYSKEMHADRRWHNRWGHPGLLWGSSRVSDLVTLPKQRIIGDSASPETIKYLKNRGFNIIPAVKGKDSIEEGVRWIQMHDVYIHPDCERAIEEWDRYSYKVDKDTEQVLPELDDVDNHVIDAVRYAVEQERRQARAASAAHGMPIIVTG